MTNITKILHVPEYYAVMEIAIYTGKQFAVLTIDERRYYGGLPDALPLGEFVLTAFLSPPRQERLRVRDSLARVAAALPEVKAGLATCLETMERMPVWSTDVRIAAQLMDAGIDPNTDLYSIVADEHLE